MKDSYYTFMEEVGKAAAALFTGAIAAYLVQRRKEKANKFAQMVIQSDFWQNQTKSTRETYNELHDEFEEFKRQTKLEIQHLQKQLDECTSLRRSQN
jgi:23S rRNA maturation mini-RNase III